MDSDDEKITPTVRSDLRDLWEIVRFLGEETEEYDARTDTTVVRFSRSPEWKEALNALRKLLKKYHSHARLPVRSSLQKWGVLAGRLLPMVTRYYEDRDFLYNMGKVLIFITALPNGKLVRSVPLLDHELRTLREYRIQILRTPLFLPAFLGLLEPALANDVFQNGRIIERSDQEINSVDLVLTMLKQLLEIPSLSEQASYTGNLAIGSSDVIETSGMIERLILAYSHNAILDAINALSRLLTRKEFKRLTVVLLDFYFQLFKHVNAETLLQASKRPLTPSVMKLLKIQSTVRNVPSSSNSTNGTMLTNKNTKLSHGSSSTLSSTTPSSFIAAHNGSGGTVKSNILSNPALDMDPLAMAYRQEKLTNAVARSQISMQRHSRFGTTLVHTSFGINHVSSKIVTSKSLNDIDNVPRAPRRNKPFGGGRRKDDAEPPLTVELPANQQPTFTSNPYLGNEIVSEYTDASQRVLYQTALQFIKPIETETSNAATTEEDDDMEPIAISSFSTLMKGIKDRFLRESDEVTPEDRLRYFHIATVIMGTYRNSTVAKIKDLQNTIKAQLKTGQTVQDLHEEYKDLSLLTFDASPLYECLDRWSFNHVLSNLTSYIDRKQYLAVSIAGTHLCELVLTVHAMLEYGDEDTEILGKKLYDSLFREQEVADMIPRLLKLYEPDRFPVPFLSMLMETSYYLRKMAERAAAEGIHIKRRKRGGKKQAKEQVDTTGTLLKKDSTEDKDEEEENNDEGDILHSLLKKFLKEKQESTDRVFEADKYAGEYAHPTVIQATIDLLKHYLTNGVKLNYYLVQLLRRISSLPNDAAGRNPTTGKPFTFHVMLYNVQVLNTVNDILADRTVQSLKSFSDVRQWALQFSRTFLKDTKENPLLFVEALFWRSEKNANAEVAQHYGLLTGNLSSLTEGGNKPKPKSKAAVAADEAEAEARKNAILSREWMDNPLEDEEAQANFSESEEDDRRQRKVRKNKQGKSKRHRKYTKTSSGSDSDSDNSVSSNSLSSSSGSHNSELSRSSTGKKNRNQLYSYASKRGGLSSSTTRISDSDDDNDMNIFATSQQRLGTALYDSEKEDNLLAQRRKMGTVMDNDDHKEGTVVTTGPNRYSKQTVTVYDEDMLTLPNPLMVQTPLVRNNNNQRSVTVISSSNSHNLKETILTAVNHTDFQSKNTSTMENDADNDEDDEDDLWNYRRAMQKRQQQQQGQLTSNIVTDSQVSIRTTTVMMEQI